MTERELNRLIIENGAFKVQLKRLEKENNELQQKFDEISKYLEYQLSLLDTFKDEDIKAKMLGAMVLVILKGDDTNES